MDDSTPERDCIPMGRAAARRSPTEGFVGSVGAMACIVGLAALLAGCLPIPDVRIGIPAVTPEYRVDPDRVRTHFEIVPGAVVPGTPPALNRSGILRFEVGEEPHTILVLMPGIFGGATSFHSLARQLVAAVPGLEVWAVDRRANALEDRSAFRDAIAARDPSIALGYYVERSGEPDGHRPHAGRDVAFLASWGIDVHLQDLDAVIALARTRASRVVLGGHSLGASLVSLYASYEGVHAGRSGQDRIDGLVLLDGTLGRTAAFRTEDRVAGLLGTGILPSSADVRQGRFPPFLDVGVSPAEFARRGVIAQLAWYRPDADAPELLTDVPMSNLALVGTTQDDGTSTLPLFAVSAGRPVGAEFDGNLPAFLLTGVEGAYSASIAGVAPGAERIEWARGDPADEPTDLRTFVQAWTHPAADYNEWYFPLVLALEMSELDASLQELEAFVPTEDVTVPTLAVGAGRGLVADVDGFSTYANLRYGSPIATYILPDFTHMDLLAAAENPLVPLLNRWLERSVPVRR